MSGPHAKSSGEAQRIFESYPSELRQARSELEVISTTPSNFWPTVSRLYGCWHPRNRRRACRI